MASVSGTPRARDPRRSVHAIAQQAANTSKVIDEAMDAGLAADHPLTVAAKQVRLERLKVKADLERELAQLVLKCTACGQEVHWVQGISMSHLGHWGHRSQRHMESQWCRSSTAFAQSFHGLRTCSKGIDATGDVGDKRQ